MVLFEKMKVLKYIGNIFEIYKYFKKPIADIQRHQIL